MLYDESDDSNFVSNAK